MMNKYLSAKITLVLFFLVSGFLSNLYGMENVVDVKSEISGMIRNGNREIKADKNLLKGQDYDGPALLRVDFMLGDLWFTTAIAKGQVWNLADIPINRLTIVHANYGAIDFPVLDVTDALNRKIKDGKLSCVVNKDISNGVDPYPNAAKELRIHYRVGNETCDDAFAEGEHVVLPKGEAKGKLVILRATYGNHSVPVPPVEELYGLPKGMLDVTERVKQIFDNKSDVVVGDKLSAGKDPAPNKVKVLRLDYKTGDKWHAAAFLEGETLRFSSEKSFTVVQAAYGIVPFPVLQVTDHLRRQVQNDGLNIVVNNKNVSKGIDPIFGKVKTLKVEYSVGGKVSSVSVKEDDTLSLPGKGDGKGKLVILKATYGDHSAPIPPMPR